MQVKWSVFLVWHKRRDVEADKGKILVIYTPKPPNSFSLVDGLPDLDPALKPVLFFSAAV